MLSAQFVYYLGLDEPLELWVSQFYNTIHLSHPALRDPLFPGLYTDNASAPLQAGAGLRRAYGFGLYSYCAYINDTAGSCTARTLVHQFRPYAVITNDVPSNYSNYTDNILHNPAFANSSSLASGARAACCLLLLGSILLLTFLVMYVWFRPLIFGGLGSLTFVLPSGPIVFFCGHHISGLFISAVSVVLAPIFFLAGSPTWAATIKKAKEANPWKIQSTQLPLRIEVSAGDGLDYARVVSGLLMACFTPLAIEFASFFHPIPITPSPDHLCFDIAL